MKTKSQLKKEYIIKNATEVFINKGFTDVTMTDIVNQCNISRGGLYKYFKSTEEIFIEIISDCKNDQCTYYQDCINKNKPFIDIFDDFLNEKKTYFLAINNTLELALYEFFLSKKNDPYYKKMLSERFESSVSTLSLILRYGAKSKEISISDFDGYSRQIILLLEGMYILALSSSLPEHLIDNQFHLIKANLNLK